MILAREVFLTQVMRQNNNLILENAMSIRKCIENPNHKELKFQFDEDSCINFNNKNVVNKYCELFPYPDFENGIIINFSNAQNYWYNKEIRENYFPNSSNIAVGDIVQIISNNYHKYKTEIYNGEFAKVLAVGETISQSAPVYVEVNGERKKKTITLLYRKVTLRLPDFDDDIEAYINDSLLESTARDLTIDEMKAVYINTVMRFKESHPHSKIKSEEFKNFLKSDDFYNAIRVKYGYSITGHKSQGGEWKSVFVDYFGRVSLRKDPLRWAYTVTTRASENLYAINFPEFGQFYKLKFSNIGNIAHLPNDAFNFDKVPTSPLHKNNEHKCKSWLFWNILSKIEDSEFNIEYIKSEEYLEKYTFRYFDELIIVHFHHKQSGFFEKDFEITSNKTSATERLETLLSKRNEVIFPFEYKATLPFLEGLYNIVSASCNDLDIRIFNISENIDKYYINYYFETSNKISYIQFFFNKNGEFSTAMPKTFGDINDEKLFNLIEKIKEYATIPTN
jgi:hypothetical protein